MTLRVRFKLIVVAYYNNTRVFNFVLYRNAFLIRLSVQRICAYKSKKCSG